MICHPNSDMYYSMKKSFPAFPRFHWLALWAMLVAPLVPVPALAVEEHIEILSRSDWPIYENGSHILALPQVSKIVEMFEEDEQVSVEIRYPGGDAGRLWAESLLAWFVSFGIPKQYLSLFPGSGGGDQLAIVLIDRR